MRLPRTLAWPWLALALGCLLVQPSRAQEGAGTGTLLLEVPEDAKVEINGYLTRGSGSQRKCVSSGLEPGFVYEYQVRVQVVRDGRTLEEVQTARLEAGQERRLVFRFAAAAEVKPKQPPAGWQPKGPTPEPKLKEPTPEPKLKEPTPEAKPKGPTSVPPAKKPSSVETTIPLPPTPSEKPGPVPPLQGPEVTAPGPKPSGVAKKQPEPTGPGSKLPGPKSSEAKPPEKKAAGPGVPEKKLPGAGGFKPAPPVVHKEPLVEKHLLAGELAQGETALKARLKEYPKDDEARFGLGGLQFLRAVERLMQSLYRYGLRSPTEGFPQLQLPFLRLPVPPNPDPMPLTYSQAREVVQKFIDDLAQAEATLAEVRDEQVKLAIHFGEIRLDFDSDGRATEAETLWRIYAKIAGRPNISPADAGKFVICFDLGDVYWLRGYCHLLMALGEVVLAYDEEEFFQRTANLFFPKTLPHGKSMIRDPRDLNRGMEGIVDLVAVAHLVRFPVQDRERMVRALGHLQTMLSMSRKSWQAILAETDDDCEWIPNPKQRGVIPGAVVTQPMVGAWLQFLDEADALLAGKKLAPYWRPAGVLGPGEERGVNLNLLFTKPADFDLILWVQGSGVAPYLEKGAVSDPQIWRRFQQVFGGNFFSFAVWFN
jgi:uncharacterized protein (TIGR03000 family)